MQIMVRALAVCEIMQIPISKYQAKNLKNQINISIQFLFDDVSGFLYLAIKNVYAALIIRFASRLIIMSNRKIHTTLFCELLCLVLTFTLPPSPEFQSSLPNFCKPLPNLREVIAALQLVLKSLLVSCIVDLLYYTMAKMTIINEAIAIVFPDFMAKLVETEDKHLRKHVVNLIDNLKQFQHTYLMEHNLMPIALIVRSPSQGYTISEQFNNFLPVRQVQMMFAILNEKEIYLHTIIRAMLKRIDIILLIKRFLQMREKKLGQVLYIMTKISKDLEKEENMVEQKQRNIENLDSKIIEEQNSFIRLFDVFNKTATIATKSAIVAAIQAQFI